MLLVRWIASKKKKKGVRDDASGITALRLSSGKCLSRAGTHFKRAVFPHCIFFCRHRRAPVTAECVLVGSPRLRYSENANVESA